MRQNMQTLGRKSLEKGQNRAQRGCGRTPPLVLYRTKSYYPFSKRRPMDIKMLITFKRKEIGTCDFHHSKEEIKERKPTLVHVVVVQYWASFCRKIIFMAI